MRENGEEFTSSFHSCCLPSRPQPLNSCCAYILYSTISRSLSPGLLYIVLTKILPDLSPDKVMSIPHPHPHQHPELPTGWYTPLVFVQVSLSDRNNPAQGTSAYRLISNLWEGISPYHHEPRQISIRQTCPCAALLCHQPLLALEDQLLEGRFCCPQCLTRSVTGT